MCFTRSVWVSTIRYHAGCRQVQGHRAKSRTHSLIALEIVLLLAVFHSSSKDYYLATDIQEMYFKTVSGDDVYNVMQKLNNRPRKCLGFKTPRVLNFFEVSVQTLTSN
ncbi:MAG: hypothetical protein GY820_34075 [Gammaproteobacteria bacterium]|nr:hypothetical protein [Gammaproteobacteria bacterium]